MTFKREEETNDNQEPENEEIPSDNENPFKEEFVSENIGIEKTTKTINKKVESTASLNKEYTPKKRKLFDDANKELKKGAVVEYKGDKYLYWNTNNSNKAQLIKTDGTKFSGTPDLDKLIVLGNYKTTKFNNNDYIVTDNNNVYSGATGNLVYTGKDNSSKITKEKIINQAFVITPESLWLNYKDKILVKYPNESINLIKQLIKNFGIEYVEDYIEKCF
jgi:hypothetical protein